MGRFRPAFVLLSLWPLYQNMPQASVIVAKALLRPIHKCVTKFLHTECPVSEPVAEPGLGEEVSPGLVRHMFTSIDSGCEKQPAKMVLP